MDRRCSWTEKSPRGAVDVRLNVKSKINSSICFRVFSLSHNSRRTHEPHNSPLKVCIYIYMWVSVCVFSLSEQGSSWVWITSENFQKPLEAHIIMFTTQRKNLLTCYVHVFFVLSYKIVVYCTSLSVLITLKYYLLTHLSLNLKNDNTYEFQIWYYNYFRSETRRNCIKLHC